MALRPEDPCSGFQHGTVVAFINEKMARHEKGPKFYLENLSRSWEEIEAMIGTILEDSEVPSEAQEACMWAGLALGMRLDCRRGHLQESRVQWLYDFAKLHKSATHALASDLKQLTEQQEMVYKEAAFQLQLAQAKLAQVQKERDLLRWKLVQLKLRAPPELSMEWPDLTDVLEMGTLGPDENQEMPGAEANATERGRRGGGEREGTEGGEDRDVISAAPEETTQQFSASLLQFLGIIPKTNYTSDRDREVDIRPLETDSLYLSGALKATSTASPEHLPVQLPDSFTYDYSSPWSCSPATQTPAPLATTTTPPVLPHMSPYYSASNVNIWSNSGAKEADPQEHWVKKRDSKLQQHRHLAFRMPGDWDCPWCKVVNFARREICFRCRRGIWLQNT